MAFFLARASRPFTLFSSLASSSTSFASSYLFLLTVLIILVTVARLCELSSLTATTSQLRRCRRMWSRRCRRHRCRGCRRWSRAVDSHPRQLDRTGGSSALSLRLVEVRQRAAVMALGGTGPAGGGRAAVTVDDDEVVLSVCYQLEGGRRPVYAIKCPF